MKGRGFAEINMRWIRMNSNISGVLKATEKLLYAFLS